MAYATDEQVSEYAGIALADLPADINRMIDRAGELIDETTLGRIDATNEDHLAAAKQAVCFQCEYWINAGESVDVTGPLQGYQIGSVQVQYGAGDNRVAAGTLAPRAIRHLFLAGLLYRGVAS